VFIDVVALGATRAVSTVAAGITPFGGLGLCLMNNMVGLVTFDGSSDIR
jgi:hypothetical protein